MGIIIDSRGSGEQSIAQKLREKNIPVEVKHVDSGDIILLGDNLVIGIERKTVSDLICSVIGSKTSFEKSNRHFYNQLEVMKSTYKKTLLIIEGDFDWNNKMLVGIYHSVIVGWQIPVIFTKDHSDTADKVAKLFLKYGNYKVSSILPMAVHKAKSPKEIKLGMLCCVEGLGIETAKKILKEEPLIISTVLGSDYLESKLSDISVNKKVSKRLMDVLFNNE
jgi:ERCC4-type nuclease